MKIRASTQDAEENGSKIFRPDIKFCFFKTYDEYERFRNELDPGDCIRLQNMVPFTEALRRLTGVKNTEFQSVVAVRAGKEAGLVLEDEIEFRFFNTYEEFGRFQSLNKCIWITSITPFAEWLRHLAGVTNKEYIYILAMKRKERKHES